MNQHSSETPLQGRVAKRVKGFYYLVTPEGQEVECKVKGSLFQDSKYDNQIAVGDWVSFRPSTAQEPGLIEAIEPRKSWLSRLRIGIQAEQVIAANVDQLILMQAAKDPSPRANFIYRMLAAARQGGVAPVLLFTKGDLVGPGDLDDFLRPFASLGLQIVQTSNETGGDEAALHRLLQGKTSVLAGPSGVGKSTLLNRLYPGVNLKTGVISAKTNKGGHTTTLAELLRVAPATWVVDTPGVREFGFWGLDGMNLHESFPGLEAFAGHCRHRDCRHVTEPGCSAKAAVDKGELHPGIYSAYLAILQDLQQDARR